MCLLLVEVSLVLVGDKDKGIPWRVTFGIEHDKLRARYCGPGKAPQEPGQGELPPGWGKALEAAARN